MILPMRLVLIVIVALLLPAGARAQDSFDALQRELWPLAQQQGVTRATFDGAFRGLTPDAAAQVIAPEILAGTLRLPAKPAMSWMFSAEQKLVNDRGQPAGRWRPHIMIYYPYLDPMPGADGAPDFHAGMISGAGSAQSSIIVPVHDFVPVKPRPPAPL